MRKALILLCVLFLAAPLLAQHRTGNIYGTVTDEEGNPLPGVTVTLTGSKTAAMTQITSAEGNFRFLSLFPEIDYVVRLELGGFKTKIEEGIIVNTGKNTNLTLAMAMGAIEEEVTVTAVSPVVDTKRTEISTTLAYEALQSLPSARDPWVILQMTPAVQVDRENVGGNESGQQAGFVALGGHGGEDTWTMDGVNITDPAATGASPTYYDYDVFEEINITIGGADVEQHTGGVSLNFVSRRGGNRISFGGRFYYTESYFQSNPPSNIPEDQLVADVYNSATDTWSIEPTQWDELQEIFGDGLGFNSIRDIKDFGFNVGGPILKDKVWWWGSYGVQEIKTTVMNGSNDDTSLNNYAFKVNLQLVPENRFEFFIHAGDKKKYGRGSSSQYPAGRNQHGKYHFGSPILKLQDEHMFGDNIFISAKLGFTDAGFGLWPADDEALTRLRTYDDDNDLYSSYSWFFSGRPNLQFTLHGTYFNDDLFGASHEVKVGFEWRHTKDQWVSGSAGNMRYNFNYAGRTMNWSTINPVLDTDASRDYMRDEFGIDIRRLYFYRGTYQGGPEGAYHVSGFFQDVIAFGRFTLKLGLRYDRQQCYTKGDWRKTIFTEDTDETYLENYYEIQQRHLDTGMDAAILALFPGIQIDPVETADTVPWSDFSPRIGLTWDVTGDGKTIAKLSAALYRSRMASWPAYLWQNGGAGGGMNFYWYDGYDSTLPLTTNQYNSTLADDVIQWEELFWCDYQGGTRNAYQVFPTGALDNTYLFNTPIPSAGGQTLVDMAYNMHWSGYDILDPSAQTPPWYQVDPNWSSDKTLEVIATVEREVLPDFAVAVDFTWRKYNGWWSNRSFSDHFENPANPGVYDGTLLTRTDYEEMPVAVPSNYTPAGETEALELYEAQGKYVYVWKAGVNDVYGWYATNTPDDYYDIYVGFNIRATKRLSNKWMAMGSFTWQDQRNYWGAEYPINPTNQWATDGKLYAYSLGAASGKYGMRTFSRWMIKMQGLYQLPYDFNVSATFNAREGHIVDEYVSISDVNTNNPLDTGGSIMLRPYGANRLPTFWNLNLRVEKVLRIGDVGKVYLMIDAFNVFNTSILNRKRDVNTGTIYTDTPVPYTFVSETRSGEPNEVLNPRILRFGVRFQF